ncbi:MAG: TIGR02221 family CRISPR-associated protein, partial [Thermoanaerobacteraceae bacterium]|nr:TIGR02221 family CRISPR-associated protein [Thermoanaerobacteraceae bacterium]
MAKILISPLGTGQLKDDNTSKREYREAVYRFQDSGKTYKTSFIASALSDYLQVDKLYLIGTSKSMWEEVYRYFSTACKHNDNDDYWYELAERVSNFKRGDKKLTDEDLSKVNDAIDKYLRYIKADATGGSHCFVIDYGLDEKEIWNNFDVIMRIGETLTEDDEIYLDITHAFRSIPLFLYIMLDLIRILKLRSDFKLAGLYYGMLDVIGELKHAPIIDLSPLYNMTLWTRGA